MMNEAKTIVAVKTPATFTVRIESTDFKEALWLISVKQDGFEEITMVGVTSKRNP
jgi:hypothetical protein